jgi:hypothetical protein
MEKDTLLREVFIGPASSFLDSFLVGSRFLNRWPELFVGYRFDVEFPDFLRIGRAEFASDLSPSPPIATIFVPRVFFNP